MLSKEGVKSKVPVTFYLFVTFVVHGLSNVKQVVHISKEFPRAREMIQRLVRLAALAEDPGRFEFQHLCGETQLSMIPVPSSGFCTQTHTQAISQYIK